MDDDGQPTRGANPLARGSLNLPNQSGDLDALGGVPFSVDLRHVGRCMAQNDLGGFQAKLGPHLGRRGVTQAVGAPAFDARLIAGPMDRAAVAAYRVFRTCLTPTAWLPIRARSVAAAEWRRTGCVGSGQSFGF